MLLGVANAAQAYEGITITAPPDAAEGHSGLTNHTFEVRLTGPVSGDVSYKVCFSGTATYAVDYNPTLGGTQQSSNCVNGRISRGQTTPDSAIGIAVVGDGVSESGRWRGEYGETVTAHLTLVGARPLDLDGRRAHTVTHTILDDDVAVSFREDKVEGREGKRVRIQVDLVEGSQGPSQSITVPFTYTQGTASPGDYDASRTSLTFRRGQTSGDLYVDLPDDSNFESDEGFQIDFDTSRFPDGMYVSGHADTRVTIKDNDYSISTDNAAYQAREDAGGFSIAVTISPAQERTVGVRVNFQDLNASAGRDYLDKHHSFPDGVLTFRPGETTRSFFIPVVNDGVFETNSLTRAQLTQTVGATRPITAELIIVDHRPADGEYTSKLTLERTSRDTVSEGQNATFRLKMHPAVQQASTVAVALAQSADDGERANWTAGAPDTHAHYVTVKFATGESMKTLTVPIRSDGRDTNGTLTVAAMTPGAHPASAGTFTARGQKVAAKVRILDTTADGDSFRSASAQQAVVTRVPSTAVTNLQVTAVDGNTAKATWDAVPHATGYLVEFESTSALADPANYVYGSAGGVTGTARSYTHNAAEAMTLTVTVTPELRDDGNVQRFDALAGTATIEVGPGVTQGAGTQDSVQAHSCDLTSVKAAVAGYVQETHHGAAHVARWERALAGLNEEAGGMTEAQARQMMAAYSPARWQPVADALDCLEEAAQPETPAAVPEIAVSGGSAITEGGTASFTVTATPAPSAPLTVTLTVGQSGDYAASGQTGARQVTVPTGGSATFEVATANDAVDEPDGSVSATVEAGTGYTVGSPDTAAVAVSDDDDPVVVTPVVSIAAGSGVTEGSPAAFTLTATPAPHAALTVSLAVTQSGDYAASGQTGARQVTIPTGGSIAFEVATVNDTADEPDGSVTATLAAGGGYAVAASPDNAASVAVADDDAAAAGAPTLSVNDVEVKEGPYRRVTFTVTLSEPAGRLGASFYYRVRESSPVSAKRNVDFWASTSKKYASIRAGETRHRILAGMVIDDSHDEDPETFEIVLSDAHGAAIADGVGVATIVNNDPLPGAFLARFGRTVAEQALEGVAARMAAPRTPGMQGMVAGQALSFDPNASIGSQAGFTSSGEESRTMTLREALSGSSFTLTGDVDGAGGTMAFWGEAPGAGGHAFATQFAGADRASELRLSGETASALLGADYARGPWLVGFALSQSASEGDYAQEGAGGCSGQTEAVCALAAKAGRGEVEASLTATVPYAAYDVSERLRLWGAVGEGAGAVTVTTGLGGSYRADTRWSMAAAGLRGELLAPPAEGSPGSGSGAGGPSLAVVSDAMWVRTSSEKTHDLAASESDVSRLRLGLEGSWGVALAGGASLTPKLELGARHDGGDAETGRGVELGGGLAWVDPGLGLTLDLSGRMLVAHDDSALEDRGVSASLVFAPDATGGRGPSFSLGQDWGGQAEGGLDALFAPEPLEEREDGGRLESRWTAEAAWGFPALGGRFTGSPHLGLGLAAGARDWTLGWRLAPATGANALSLGVTATRRESDTAPAEHRMGVELNTRW